MAGKVRLELTTCGFGDHHSSQLSYFPVSFNLISAVITGYRRTGNNDLTNASRLAGLLVESMLAFKFAELHLLQAFRSIAFLLLGRIITTLALRAFQNNQFACHCRKLFSWFYRSTRTGYRKGSLYDIIPNRRLGDSG